MAWRPQQRRAIFIATASTALIAIAAWFAVTWTGDAQSIKTPKAASPTASELPMQAAGGMTSRELTFARNIARYWIAKAGAKTTSASVTASAGKQPDHNVGDACMSGRLLNILVLGDFPNIAPSGPANFSGKPNLAEDYTVRSMHITADAKTGHACLAGVGTKPITAEANAVFLPVN